MKIIHQNGYTADELMAWRAAVYKNLLESAHTLIAGVRKFDYTFEEEKNQVRSL